MVCLYRLQNKKKGKKMFKKIFKTKKNTTFSIDSEVLEKFDIVCKKKEDKKSEVVKILMEQYIANEVADYVIDEKIINDVIRVVAKQRKENKNEFKIFRNFLIECKIFPNVLRYNQFDIEIVEKIFFDFGNYLEKNKIQDRYNIYYIVHQSFMTVGDYYSFLQYQYLYLYK